VVDVVGYIGLFGVAYYDASKGGLNALTKAAALEYASSGIIGQVLYVDGG
jgi:NAD(P)-dependent dehydrogenase (short-subunit alcohol dehydrogenase family)